VTLFEFDKRFAVYGKDFILYDYNTPLDIPCHFARNFDVVVVDPPFLSEECLNKTAVTVKFLAKHKIILCTGLYFCDIFMFIINIRQIRTFIG
jgi:16S rRNA G966 N2-methylase RsmD